jgi:hypothetical protein
MGCKLPILQELQVKLPEQGQRSYTHGGFSRGRDASMLACKTVMENSIVMSTPLPPDYYPLAPNSLDTCFFHLGMIWIFLLQSLVGLLFYHFAARSPGGYVTMKCQSADF